jgi:hypothetical protein
MTYLSGCFGRGIETSLFLLTGKSIKWETYKSFRRMEIKARTLSHAGNG